MKAPTLQEARAWYPGDDIHGLGHITRVYHLAEHLAQAEGADLEIVRAAALLHDAIHADARYLGRAEHHQASAAFARDVLTAHNWPEAGIQAVEHCIRAHRYRDRREEPQTLEARILFDADKLDAIGAIGIARAIAHATQSGAPIYAPPSERFIVSGQREADEPHSAYHEYVFKLSKIRARLYTPTARHLAEKRHRTMVDYFEALQAEMQTL